MKTGFIIRHIAIPVSLLLIVWLLLFLFSPSHNFTIDMDDVRAYVMILLGWFVLGVLFDLLDDPLKGLHGWRYLPISVIMTIVAVLYFDMLSGAKSDDELYPAVVFLGGASGLLIFLLHFLWLRWTRRKLF